MSLSVFQAERQHCQAVELLEVRHVEVVEAMREAHQREAGHMEERIRELQKEIAGLKAGERNNHRTCCVRESPSTGAPGVSRSVPASRSEPPRTRADRLCIFNCLQRFRRYIQ